MPRKLKICALPGDGIGPEVVTCALRVLQALPIKSEVVTAAIGYGAYQEYGTPLPENTLAAIRASDAALLGAVTTPPNIKGYFSPIVRMRQNLDLFANLRPCVSIQNPVSKPGINFMLFRENTEGLYSGIERVEENGERAITERVITRKASERIVRKAFEYAAATGRKSVHIVHKANVLRETCGLFLRTAREVAAEFPQIEAKELIVDACAMEIVRRPEQFEVIVTTNLFGDILSDEASMFVGGLGLAASGNIGNNASVFEPVHGSAPDLVGKGTANPIATILALAMLLDHMEEPVLASYVRLAVDRCILFGATTPDLGGQCTTTEATDSILKELETVISEAKEENK